MARTRSKTQSAVISKTAHGHNNSSAAATPTTQVSTFTEGVTQPTQLCLLNKSGVDVAVHWVTYDGQLQQYTTIRPQGSYTLSSFSTHPWQLQYASGHSATYVGDSALLVLLPNGKLEVKPFAAAAVEDAGDSSWQDPAWGSYEQRGSVLDMAIMAYECVCQEAVQQAACVVQHMLAGCRASTVQRMVAAGCRIAIIGRHQVTTDIPPHHFMKAHSLCEGARDIDGTTRGLGATSAVPTTSCGEENVTMVDDRRYASESILVHEFGHAVMNLGLTQQQLRRVHACYDNARKQQLYDLDCYMMENADEYWAEGCQSWFDATVRTDVNSGINTRPALKQHDPRFARLLTEVFGDGAWRYPHTAPAPFKCNSTRKQPQQQQEEEKPQRAQRSSRQSSLGQELASAALVRAARPSTRSATAAKRSGGATAAQQSRTESSHARSKRKPTAHKAPGSRQSTRSHAAETDAGNKRSRQPDQQQSRKQSKRRRQ